MTKSGSVCVLAVIFIGVVCAELKPDGFLLRHDFLVPKSGYNKAENPTPEEMEKELFKFQRFTEPLPETEAMENRCKAGDQTIVGKWHKNVITWKISKYSQTSRLSQAEQRSAIRRAINRWAEVIPLEIKETESKPDIDISFTPKYYGDGYLFKVGPPGTGSKETAHTNYPPDGTMYFNDEVNWVNDKTCNFDLETIAAHEFGHALGLRHSPDPESLMYPCIHTFPPNFKLGKDDVDKIQRLYGKKGVVSDGFCGFKYNHIDASMRVNEADFVFVDNDYVIDGRNGQKMYIQELFPEGPWRVDAAVYSDEYEKAFLFDGQWVWSYRYNYNDQFSLVDNFPKGISNTFNPEAAMQLNSGNIFLLKDGYVTEFSPQYADVVDGNYFRANSVFHNIPSRVDATVVTSTDVYFIVNKVAYKMPMATRVVDATGIPTAQAFSPCKNY